MDEDTQFVQILFSNASMGVYPANKPQNFKVHLPQPLDLQGVWSVGLKAIQYPHNWYSVRKDFKFSIHTPDNKFKLAEVAVPAGQYSSIAELCESINKAIAAEYKKEKDAGKIERNLANKLGDAPLIGLTFNRFEQNVQFRSADAIRDAIIEFSKTENKDILSILGIYPEATLAHDEKGKRDATLEMHFPALFVYTPIIQYSAVGDTRAPLLALIPVTGRHKEYIFERYERPLFHRLAHNQISDIEVHITDDTGEHVRFLAGKVTLILEFRRQA